MKKMETDGLEKMSLGEKKRLKRLITLEQIKTNNILAGTGNQQYYYSLNYLSYNNYIHSY